MRIVYALIGVVLCVANVSAAELRVEASEARAARSLAVLEIEGTPSEFQHGFNWIGEGSDTLLGLITTIDTLAFDPEFDGLVIRLKDAVLGSTQIEELGTAMARYRDEGKKIHLFAEYYDPGALLLGSYADEVILQKGGFVSFPGIHMEEMYLASMLEWVGVKAQLVQVGDYKGANETMTRSAPSEAWDRNISGLLDAMYGEMRAKLKEGRDLSDRELDRAMEEAWSASGEEAIEVGLIDAEVDLPELKTHLSDEYNTEITWAGSPGRTCRTRSRSSRRCPSPGRCRSITRRSRCSTSTGRSSTAIRPRAACSAAGPRQGRARSATRSRASSRKTTSRA
jgi:ClpP class serine protease